MTEETATKDLPIERLIEQFESGTLAPKDWNHFTHLKIILWYLYKEKDVWKAAGKFKVANIIRKSAIQTLDQVLSQYHETQTIFWTLEVYNFYHLHKKMKFEELYAELLATPKFFDKSYIYKFYETGILDSAEARTIFVPSKKIR